MNDATFRRSELPPAEVGIEARAPRSFLLSTNSLHTNRARSPHRWAARWPDRGYGRRVNRGAIAFANCHQFPFADEAARKRCRQRETAVTRRYRERYSLGSHARRCGL